MQELAFNVYVLARFINEIVERDVRCNLRKLKGQLGLGRRLTPRLTHRHTLKMEPLISSDAVAETFSKGVAIKLSDCSPKFQLYFSDAREVNLYAQTSHVNDIYIIY